MRKTGFLIFGGVTLAAMALAACLLAWRTQSAAPESTAGLVYPGLKDRLESVAEVTAESKTKRFVIRRDGDSWVIADRDNYAADSNDVRRNLLALAEMRKIEAMTDKPEFHSRLGVGDPKDDPDAIHFVLRDGQGGVLAEFIAGRYKQRAAPGREAELYIRKSAENQAWLVRADWDAPADPLEWLNREIMRISRDRVAEVQIRQATGETLTIRPNPKDQGLFAIVGLPANREPISDGDVNGIGGGLEFLAFDEVESAEKKAADFDRAPITALYRLKEGLAVRISILPQSDGKAWTRFRFEGEAEGDVAQEWARLKAQVEPWGFLLAEFRARDLSRKMADITEPKGGNKQRP